MEDRQQLVAVQDDEINLSEYFTIIRHNWWKIIGLSFAAGIIMLLLLFLKPNIYKANAIITPAEEEGKQSSAFGALAAFGISFGGPTKVEDLEALFKSNDLTVRVFHKYNLWPIVLPDKYDLEKGKLKVGFIDRILGEEKGEYKDPTDWDAIRVADDRMKVSVNRKIGTLSVSFESPSPEGSAKIVKYYLDEGKSRLQEEAFSRANKNKKFIEYQIGKTVDALTRDRLYSLYGQEVEKEMLAKNREQFGFKIIDSPRIPDEKSSPRRAIISAIIMAFSIFLWCAYFIVRAPNNKN
jgi:uncharacterized protein involved in exopolysaccharide biosynthesis